MTTPTNRTVCINVQPFCWETSHENLCGGYLYAFGIASSSKCRVTTFLSLMQAKFIVATRSSLVANSTWSPSSFRYFLLLNQRPLILVVLIDHCTKLLDFTSDTHSLWSWIAKLLHHCKCHVNSIPITSNLNIHTSGDYNMPWFDVMWT
jgi:hypothetical protein